MEDTDKAVALEAEAVDMEPHVEGGEVDGSF